MNAGGRNTVCEKLEMTHENQSGSGPCCTDEIYVCLRFQKIATEKPLCTILISQEMPRPPASVDSSTPSAYLPFLRRILAFVYLNQGG